MKHLPIKKNKRIVEFMLRQIQPYWTRYKFGKKVYIMSFQYDLFEVIEN